MIQSAMAQADLDGLVLTRNGTVTYMTGALSPWRTAVVIPSDGEPEVVAVQYDIDRLMDQTWIRQSRAWDMADEDSFGDAVAQSVKAVLPRARKIGLEIGGGQHQGVISASEYRLLMDKLKAVELVPAMKLLDELMMLKSPAELELLRRAAEITDVGMEAAFAHIAPGRTELEIVGQAEAAMRTAGNEFVWSVTGSELGSGYRQSYNKGFTALPSTKRIQHGDMITIDLHSTFEGYLGDLALNAIVGKPSAEQEKLHSAWRYVCDALMDALRPGVIIGDAARAAHAAADDQGYGAHLMPFLGHGLGTDARIPPTVTEKNEDRLAEGATLVAHVHMAVPGIGGLKLETATVVSSTGCERLDRTPFELRVIS